MTDRQTLLASLRGFLAERLQADEDAYRAFETRIAINLLAVLEREAVRGSELECLDEEIGATLGTASPGGLREVARALRDGRVDEDADLLERLRRRAVLKLAIDNPRYSGLRHALGRWPELREIAEPSPDPVQPD